MSSSRAIVSSRRGALLIGHGNAEADGRWLLERLHAANVMQQVAATRQRARRARRTRHAVCWPAVHAAELNRAIAPSAHRA